MQIKMIFGTILPPPKGETDPVDLKAGSTVTVSEDIGEALIEAGRAEPTTPGAE
jgi:hypothetical protein